MYAIFKKEMKSYFYSPVAYVLIGLFILISSIVFYLGNLSQSSGDLNSVFSFMSIILVFIVPILTMRILAEDRKNGTEVLLLTSPVKLSSIVIGKYLAAVLVFLVMNVISLVYPIILFALGKPHMSMIIGGYIGFILLGSVLIAIGVFASSLTENQIIAALISFVAMIIIMLFIDYLAKSVGGLLSTILTWFSLTSRYSDFTTGIFNVDSVIYYLSFIFMFIFMTIRVIEKRRWSQG